MLWYVGQTLLAHTMYFGDDCVSPIAWIQRRWFAVAGYDHNKIHIWDTEQIRQRLAAAIPVNNRSPNISLEMAEESVYGGRSIHLSLSATDPDDDSVHFIYRTSDDNHWRADLDGNITLPPLKSESTTVTVYAVDRYGAKSKSVEQTISVIRTKYSSWKPLRTYEPRAYGLTEFESRDQGRREQGNVSTERKRP